ncbi:MAG: asparagine synthase-related protein, partial [Pseudonocardiaceae bacterium]
WLTPQATELVTPDDGVSGPARPDSNARTLREVQAVGRTARADAQLAEAFGLTIHNPYADSSVIAAALSVPPWRRGDPWHYKPLLIMAVGDLLPRVIASRTTKGGFDADHYRGLRANLPAVLD